MGVVGQKWGLRVAVRWVCEGLHSWDCAEKGAQALHPPAGIGVTGEGH